MRFGALVIPSGENYKLIPRSAIWGIGDSEQFGVLVSKIPSLDTILFWPSVGIGFRHRTFRALLWWPEHGIGFCGLADSVAIMLNAVSPWFCIGDSKHRFGGPSMVSGFYGPVDGVVVMLNAVSP